MKRANKKLARQSAQRLLEKYSIDKPWDIPFQAILGAENVFYQERQLKGCLGNIVRTAKRGVITISNTIKHKGQKRFVIAHELGHWTMHKDIPNFNCDDENMNQWHSSDSKYEIEANYFAAEFLMPNSLVKSYIGTREFSAQLVLDIAKKFHTSITATSFRLTEIEIDRITVIFSIEGRCKWFKQADDFPFKFYDKKFPVPPKTMTASYYTKPFKEVESGTCVAQQWFTKDWSVPEDSYLYEEIIPFPSIKGCITFLWQYEVDFESF